MYLCLTQFRLRFHKSLRGVVELGLKRKVILSDFPMRIIKVVSLFFLCLTKRFAPYITTYEMHSVKI